MNSARVGSFVLGGLREREAPKEVAVRYAARTMPAAPRMNVLLLVYLVAGAIVASTHHYYAHLHTAKQYGSAALAVVFWPLLLLGINLHIH